MRDPEKVLREISSKAKNPDYVFKKLYRNFYNIEFYKKAYAKINAKPRNMTPGSDGQTIAGFSLDKVETLIDLMKSEQYQPLPVKRVFIDKKNSMNKRPLGIPVFYDKLVQEVLRDILQGIYEPTFSSNSHGFRPNKSCHTALYQVKKSFTGVKWWIKGEIKGFFDNINYHILIKILRRRIADEKFIRLIWKFLKAGYIYEKPFHKTFGGTPQGGIVSPILANIYLNELDRKVQEIMDEFNTGKRQRRAHPHYKLLSQRIEHKMKILDTPSNEEIKKLEEEEEKLLQERREYTVTISTGKRWEKDTVDKSYIQKLEKVRRKLRTPSQEEKNRIINENKNLKAERAKLPAMDNLDPEYKRLKYVRYADDFIIGVIGSKSDAEQIKEKLTVYLRERLDLELSQEKTLITHNSEKVRFLGYDIFITEIGNEEKITKINNHNSGRQVRARTNNGQVKLSLPHDKLKDFLFGNGYIKILPDGRWKPTHRRELLNNEDLEIIQQCNAEFRGFYQYYKLAYDVKKKLGSAHFLWTWSVNKTLAGKHKTKIRKLRVMEAEFNGEKVRKYYQKGKWGVAFVDQKGTIRFTKLFEYSEIQVEKEPNKILPKVNVVPRKRYILRKNLHHKENERQ